MDQFLEESWLLDHTLLDNFETVRLLIRVLHQLLEEGVDFLESSRLFDHCLFDIGGSDIDVLEIHPVLLALYPLVNNVTQGHDVLLPLLGRLSEGLHVARSEDRIDESKALVKSCVDLLKIFENVRIDFLFVLNREDDSSPVILKLLEVHFQAMFLLSSNRDGDDLLLVVVDIKSNQGLQSEIFLRDVELLPNMILNLLPMAICEFVVPESNDDRHCFLEGFHPGLQLLLNQVWLKVLLELHGCLEILVRFQLNILSLY